MADLDLFQRINALSDEEEQLYESASDGSGLSEAERDRLDQIKVELDRCYDLLHQRQARGRGDGSGRGPGTIGRDRRVVRAVAMTRR
jgi:Protein of unknown function (DUF2630)